MGAPPVAAGSQTSCAFADFCGGLAQGGSGPRAPRPRSPCPRFFARPTSCTNLIDVSFGCQLFKEVEVPISPSEILDVGMLPVSVCSAFCVPNGCYPNDFPGSSSGGVGPVDSPTRRSRRFDESGTGGFPGQDEELSDEGLPASGGVKDIGSGSGGGNGSGSGSGSGSSTRRPW